jgi:hypothetical protein
MPALLRRVVLLRELGDFLYTLKAGPAGGPRPPSGPRQRHDGHRGPASPFTPYVLVITDRCEQVAGGYAVQSPTRSNTTATAGDYRASKPDGAMAVERTVDLPNDELVVVASTALIRLGPESVRRSLLHEAQHVQLHQHRDSAMAVHRRLKFELPDDVIWEFLWLAESVVDEFRCGRAMHEKGLGSSGLPLCGRRLPWDRGALRRRAAQLSPSRRSHGRLPQLVRCPGPSRHVPCLRCGERGDQSRVRGGVDARTVPGEAARPCVGRP